MKIKYKTVSTLRKELLEKVYKFKPEYKNKENYPWIMLNVPGKTNSEGQLLPIFIIRDKDILKTWRFMSLEDLGDKKLPRQCLWAGLANVTLQECINCMKKQR